MRPRLSEVNNDGTNIAIKCLQKNGKEKLVRSEYQCLRSFCEIFAGKYNNFYQLQAEFINEHPKVKIDDDETFIIYLIFFNDYESIYIC